MQAHDNLGPEPLANVDETEDGFALFTDGLASQPQAEWGGRRQPAAQRPRAPQHTRSSRLRTGTRGRRSYPWPGRAQPSSEYVRWVQSALNQIMALRLPLDGMMGPALRSALRSFQKREGLPVDGVVGPETERALLAARGGTPPETSDKASASEFEYEWESEVNRSSPEYIRWVQQALNKTIGVQLVVDGISGSMTRSAVRSFQQRQGLMVDGIVGPQTEGALIAAGATNPPSDESVAQPGSAPVFPNINVELPLSGPGFYSYDRTSSDGRPHQYGRAETIKALLEIAAAWQRAHPQGPEIGIGHLSLLGGGDTPAHTQHETGLEVDIRPVRTDLLRSGVKYQDPLYSRSLTQELVNLIRANRILPVYRILFNDSDVTGTTPVQDHDNHLHVWFSEPPASSGYASTYPGGSTTGLAWGARVSAAFRSRVRQIGAELSIDPNFLMAVMAFESNKTFSPSIRNASSGATGLIQFIPSTATRLGTSTDALARMTAEQQLDYVAAYFRPYRGRIKSIEDVYMVVLWPKAVGSPNETVLFATPSREYDWNRGLDANDDGRITKAEAAAPVKAKLGEGLGAGLVG